MELKNYTIRMEEETKNLLSDMSADENLKQGEFLKKLLMQYSRTKPQSSGLIRLPIESQIFSCKKNSIIYEFEGRLIYRTNQQTLAPEQYLTLIQYLQIDSNYTPVIANFAFMVYKTDTEFVLHEFINASSIHDDTQLLNVDVWIQRAAYYGSLEDIINSLKGLISPADVSNLRFSDAPISRTRDDLTQYFRKGE
ncbi:MAG: hypothetical protein JXR88_13710 [Clostridia bacterium]|nr:hypothetical protein [Clostridia bacterium]